jgi:tryptophan synthase alpha chain
MSIGAVFSSTRERDEIALIPYVTAGYPRVSASLDFVQAAADAGADAIEIGLPFSDPVADGPTIQAASHEALVNGFKVRPFLAELRTRPRACPVIVMTYLNPLLALGEDAFPLLAEAGVCAVVIPDLPEEEAAAVASDAARSGIDLVLLVAPTSSPERLRRIGSTSKGFVYVVGLVGVTGARNQADPALPSFLDRVRATTTLPLVAGFGLSDPEHVRAIAAHTDGVIVGSRFVDAIRRGENFKALVRSFKTATRRH